MARPLIRRIRVDEFEVDMINLMRRLRHGVAPLLWGLGSLALLLVASAMCSYVALAAVVSLQPPANNEAVLRIPVIVTGEADEVLSGLQFDVDYDTNQFTLEGIEPGAAAQDAGKETILSEPSPGTGRVLITGFNNNGLIDGHVATLILRPRVAHADGDQISLGNFLATDPFGNSVPFDYENTYDYPPKPPEKVNANQSETTDEGGAAENTDIVDDGEVFGTTEPTTPAPDRRTDTSVLTSLDGDLGTGTAGTTTTPRNNDTASPKNHTTVVSTSAPSAARRPGERSGGGVPTAYSIRVRTPSNARSGSSATSRISTEKNSTFAARDTAVEFSTAPDLPETLLALYVSPADAAARQTPPVTAQADWFSDASPLQPLGKIHPAGLLLFVVFFLGFAALHQRLFRRISAVSRRQRP